MQHVYSLLKASFQRITLELDVGIVITQEEIIQTSYLRSRL